MSSSSSSSQQTIADDEDNASDISVASSSSSCESEPEPSKANYQVLDAAAVVDLMNNEIAKVKDIVKLPNEQLRVVLSKSRWDINAFLEKFYDGRIETPSPPAGSPFPVVTDTAQLKENRPDNHQIATHQMATRSSKRKNDKAVVNKVPAKTLKGAKGKPQQNCEICWENVKPEHIRQLSCAHKFCKACLKSYFKVSIGNNFTIDCIECPAHECSSPCDDELVSSLLSATLKKKYQQLITNGFVVNNRLIKWCKSPGCTKAIMVDHAQNQPAVRCSCDFLFCFSCSQEIHDLIPCKLVRDFNEAKAANLETASWVASHSKPCPRCHVDIEKNGGCNHMHCRQCKFDFCWLCLREMRSGHIHGRCQAVNEGAFTVGQSAHLRRLVDCNTKYGNMMQSIKLDEKQYKVNLEQQELEAEDQGAWYKIDFIKAAVEVLLNCRRSLADSFIFNYFYQSETDINFCRYHLSQSSLIQGTEELSHILEKQVNSDNFHELKRTVVNKTKYCHQLQGVMSSEVTEGFDNDVWKSVM